MKMYFSKITLKGILQSFSLAITLAIVTSSSSFCFTGARMSRSIPRNDYIINNKVVPPPTRQTDTHMGWSTALSEDETTLISGAPIDGYDASSSNYFANAGSVNVYIKSAGNWVFQQKLVAPTRRAQTYFGSSVAISGDTIVVGAYGETMDEGNANALSASGAAYVFTRSGSTWSFQKKLIGTGTQGRRADDQYGYSVGIYNDTIVVGAWYQDFDSVGSGGYINAAGAVFIYTGSGSSWTLQQRVATEATAGGRTAESRFGCSVSINGDTIVIGSMNHSLDAVGLNSVSETGAAYILKRTSGVWNFEAKLSALGANSRGDSDAFGHSVSINGDTAVIGAMNHDYDTWGSTALSDAGAVFIYTRSGTTWNFRKKLTGVGINGRLASDGFGNGVSVSGKTLLVGSYNQSYDSAGANYVVHAGAAYVFVQNNGDWYFQKKLVGTGTNGRVASDEFGTSVAVSGNTLAVGARLQDYDVTGSNVMSASGAIFIYNKK
jgi:hypothetical protein